VRRRADAVDEQRLQNVAAIAVGHSRFFSARTFGSRAAASSAK
jgi:hypothetical protein